MKKGGGFFSRLMNRGRKLIGMGKKRGSGSGSR